jgi:hypothetical protein
MEINNKLTSNHQIIADNFNKYFASIAANINNTIMQIILTLTQAKLAH